MQKLRKIINNIFYLGINDDMPFDEVVKTFMFNLFVIISLPFILSFIPINIIHRNYHLLSFNITLLTLYSYGFWINISRRWLWSRQLVLIFATAIFFIGPVLYNNGTEYNMLMTLMAAVILFDKKIYFFLYAILVVAALTYLWYRPMADINLLSSKIINHYTNIFYSEILFVISIFSFKYIYVKYQKQLVMAYEQLRESEKRRDELLQFVAHDLRNPIGAIVNYLDIVQFKYEHADSENKILQSMKHAATHSIDLINDLQESDTLLTSRAPVDINGLAVEAVEQLLHKATNKQQNIIVQKTMQPLVVSADADKIRRVLVNLLDNAVKFSYTNSEIQVILSKEEGYAYIKVAETGIGIPVSLQKNLFTSDAAVGRAGTRNEKSKGLGLSICKQIVGAHGGILEVESVEGKGSVFTVALPVV